MPTPPKRRWLARLSPFRWLEVWLDRMERRQQEMLVESEHLRLQIAAARAQVEELRADLELLRAEAAELAEARTPVPPDAAAVPPLPVGRRCPSGHTAPAAARFCPECGHVFPTRSGGGGGAG